MALRLRLSWTDSNGAELGHRVYRADVPMDPDEMPAPVATLGPDVTEYVDESVLEGSTYFYRVGAFTAFMEKISAEVSRTVALIPQIGEYWPEQGGYYAGVTALGFYLIVAPKDAEVTRQWKTANTDTPGTAYVSTASANDLRAAVEAAGIASHPAMQYCAAYAGGGFTDWALPGWAERAVIDANLNPATTVAPLFQSGGAQQYRNGATHTSAADWWYWLGAQTSASAARMHRPASPGALGTWPSKTETRPIRPIRIVPISS